MSRTPTGPPPPGGFEAPRRRGAEPLTRSRDERLIAGVCAGLAEHLGVPVSWVRGSMLAFALLGGAGALLYLWLWITVPWDGPGLVRPMREALTTAASTTGGRAEHPSATGSRPGGATEAQAAEPVDGPSAEAAADAVSSANCTEARSDEAAADRVSEQEREAVGRAGAEQISGTAVGSEPDPEARERSRWPVAELLLGGALLIAGIGLVLVQFGVDLNLPLILPGMVVLVGVGLTWWQIADRDRPERNQLPRILGALGLVAVGVLTFFLTAKQPNALTVIAAALAVLAGVALALAPWLLRINRDLITERAARAREAERAEIAAHLHDSVLQTLAAIQQRSEPGSEVARLARGQERELRDWLFRAADGAEPPQLENADVALRAHAVALEEAHPVRFEVIGVGTEQGLVVPEAIVAAAKEAMLNAARHAGGAVSVYVELTPRQASIDVTDRGPGLDPAELPEGRMGVRESIIGRMERAGGTARIVPGPGGTGTSVRLALPMSAPQTGPTPVAAGTAASSPIPTSVSAPTPTPTSATPTSTGVADARD